MGHVVTLHMQSSRAKRGVTLSSETGRTNRPHKSLPLSKMDYETKFFPRIGGFGRYTKKVVVWSWFPSFAVALNVTSSMFLTMTPETFHCRPDPLLLPMSNLTEEELIRASIPWDEDGGPSRCELLKNLNGSVEASGSSDEWERVPCTRGWVYSTEWNLVCKDSWQIPVHNICFVTGSILGYIVFGALCDRLGRRHCFTFALILSCVFGAVICFSESSVVSLPLRLCQGLSLAGVSVSSYITRLELCDLPHRLTVAMVAVLFAVGAETVLPAVALACHSWQILQAVVTLPLVLLLPYWCCVSVFPESPRWQLATSQIPQVKWSLKEFTIRNQVCLLYGVAMTDSLLSEINSVYEEDCQPRFYSLLSLLHHPVTRRNCLTLSFTVFTAAAIQHCFTTDLYSYSTHFYLNYYVRVSAAAAASVFLYLLANRYGRRGVLLFSAIATCLPSLLLLAFKQNLYGVLVLALSTVGLLFCQVLAVLSVFFACEVMPTVIRGGCLGLVLASYSAGTAASFLVGLQTDFYYLYHLILAFFTVFSIIVILRLPESNRRPLPDFLEEGESQRRPLILPSPLDGAKQLGAQNLWKDQRRKSLRVERTPAQALEEHADIPDGNPETPPLSLSDTASQDQEYETLAETESETAL
ncbi:putative solute carrier family 22 member 31 isoform X2 [Nelusetta ayraudi]|uniref:putative solute carrier family 22 member 31 isoform X2 n=1 Tax=Nelusetta ayraudi TaxID=303726 RepID=UPI003F6F1004